MRILIVEDEHKIANSLRQGLEQEGFAVDVEFNGDTGYDLAVTEDYDLAILDIMLPGMDGLQICANLRKNNKHYPVLILTSKDQIEDRVEGLNYGADDYLTKPFAFTELLARIRALLRRPNDLIPSLLKCGDLSLNSNTFEVTRGNKSISLSRKEFALLEYLLRNKNQVLTKDKIIEHVWSYDSDVLPNTVEVYMGYLRNKLEKPFKDLPRLLKTMRGYGYSINCDD